MRRVLNSLFHTPLIIAAAWLCIVLLVTGPVVLALTAEEVQR